MRLGCTAVVTECMILYFISPMNTSEPTTSMTLCSIPLSSNQLVQARVFQLAGVRQIPHLHNVRIGPALMRLIVLSVLQ